LPALAEERAARAQPTTHKRFALKMANFALKDRQKPQLTLNETTVMVLHFAFWYLVSVSVTFCRFPISTTAICIAVRWNRQAGRQTERERESSLHSNA